jgi:hypothetical protein
VEGDYGWAGAHLIMWYGEAFQYYQL